MEVNEIGKAILVSHEHVSKAPFSLASILPISLSDLISPCSCHLFLYSESYLTPIEPSDRPDLLNL